MKHTTPLLLGALAAVALTGCSATAHVEPAGSTATTAAVASSAPASTPSSSASAPASPTATSTPVLPTGQPPRPGQQDQYPKADTVPGLPGAIAAAEHPGLQICSGELFSLVTASGDLRGNSGRQYLVDTTCDGATTGSPDEIALYDVHGGSIARSAVLSEYTANRPKPTAYPYLWQGHTVVLVYGGGTEYRLIQLTPDSVVSGTVQTFH